MHDVIVRSAGRPSKHHIDAERDSTRLSRAAKIATCMREPGRGYATIACVSEPVTVR